MGTNYFCKTGRKLDHYGFEVDEILHIGKSSYGWYFTLHIYPDKEITSLIDWLPLLQNGVIHNEYGEEVSYEDMKDCILREGRWNWDFTNMPRTTESHVEYDILCGERGLHYVKYNRTPYNSYQCDWCTLPAEYDLKGLYRYEVGDFR